MKTAKEIYNAFGIHSNPSLGIKAIQDGIDEHTAPLLDRIKALEVELERAKAERNAEGVRQRGEYLPKLDRAHKALKLAGEALEAVKCRDVEIASSPIRLALAAIKACGVGL